MSLSMMLNVLLLLLVAVLGLWIFWPAPQRPPLPLTIGQIEELSELTTLCVHVADVQEEVIQGRLGAVHALVLVQGEVEIGFDLTQARLAADGQVILPEPTIRRPRLDHDRTRIVAIWHSGLWALIPGQGEINRRILNQALQQSQQRIGDAVTEEMKQKAIMRARWCCERLVRGR